MNKLAIKERNHAWHWSSTENKTTVAYCQGFGDGCQGTNGKAIRYWVRAVRRVKKVKISGN